MAGLYLVVYASVLILVALFQPRGIAPLIMRSVDRVKSFVGARRRGIAIAEGK